MSAYVDLTTRFVYGMQTVFGDFSKLANNDEFIRANGWADGTMGVFVQAAAPTGWTKNTLINARSLRVVSGSGGGVGGTADPATTITLAHTHVIPTQADHTHSLAAHTLYLGTGTLKSSASGVTPIMALAAATINYPAKALANRILSGSTAVWTKKNELNMTGGPYTTGPGGSHNHGGVTTSQLSNLSLAYLNVLFCSKDTSTGYTDLTSTFVHNVRHVFNYLSQCAANDAFNYARRTPAGTVSLFCSAAAPTGWTKLTTSNAKLLRIVNDLTGAATGGSADPATLIQLAHNHGTMSSDGTHTHTLPAHTHELSDANNVFAVASGGYIDSGGEIREYAGAGTTPPFILSVTNLDGAVTSDTAGNHTHLGTTMLSNISLFYVNVIQASKDSTGVAQTYTDYTSFFADQGLLAYQDLQVMANNDAYLYYHTMPASAVMFFFQSSAPVNWTKATTNNDRLLRIVSDTSGAGTGGSVSPAAVITMAHSHTIDSNNNHAHSALHVHTMATGGPAGTAIGSGSTISSTPRVFGANGAEMYVASTGAGADSALKNTTSSQYCPTDGATHNHGGATGSALADVTLAYADVIQCVKN